MSAESKTDKLTDLRDLQWANRILLVFPGGDSGDDLIGELEARSAEIVDRDIAWFVVSADGVETNYPKPLADHFAEQLREGYAPAAEKLTVVLIGKDGGTKQRYDKLDLPAVFARIDSMPMRQAEMRRE